MQQFGQSIYGTRGSIIPPKDWGTMTIKGNMVYMHILNKPENPAYVFIPEFTKKISKALLLNGNKEIKFKQQAEGTFIYLDGIVLDDIDTIIQLDVK